MYSDLVALTPEQYFKQITKRLAEIKAVSVSVATQEDHSSQSADTRITRWKHQFTSIKLCQFCCSMVSIFVSES